MDHTSTIRVRRRPKPGPLVIPKEEPLKTPEPKNNAEAMLIIKMDSLPEIKTTRDKNNVMLPLRTPQLGFLQIIVTGRTYRKVRNQILELDEETDYKIIIKTPYDRLQRKGGTPTCLGSNMELLIKKPKKTPNLR